MKIQLARKLHRLPQPSTLPDLGRFAFWQPRQAVTIGQTSTDLATSSRHFQTASANTAN